MNVVIHSAVHAGSITEGLVCPLVFLPTAVLSVERVLEAGIVNMDFIWAYTDDWTWQMVQI